MGGLKLIYLTAAKLRSSKLTRRDGHSPSGRTNHWGVCMLRGYRQ